MKIIGHFNNITNDQTYWLQIGSAGETKYIQDGIGENLNEEAVCWGEDPIIISSDMADTFENVYIRSCEINLVTNFDIREYVVANNYTDIPVVIRYDDEEGDIIFSGSVIPLTFNQTFAANWNEFTLNCVDKLGILEYIKLPKVDGIDTVNYNTPRYFIEKILSNCDFSDIEYSIEYDHTQDTKINPNIFVGESEDDWMNCKEALEEIGKIYGCYFYQDGDVCKVENILLYDLSNTVAILKDDYAADDTNISIADAYNRIACTVDLSTVDDTFIDPFSDDYMTPTTTKAERVLTEIIVKNKKKYDNFYWFQMWAGMAVGDASLGVDPIRDWTIIQQYNNTSELDIYETYCQIVENKTFTFPTPNYLGAGQGSGSQDAYKTLQWLWNNPGKGAFLSFGTTDDIAHSDSNSVVKSPDMESAFVIQVNGNRVSSDYDDIGTVLENQIEANTPVCEFNLNSSQNIIPKQTSSTNYLVIQGKIRLNPITPRVGPDLYTGIDVEEWKDAEDPDENEYRDPWYMWRMASTPLNYMVAYWRALGGEDIYADPYYNNYNVTMYYRLTRNNTDDDGMYYQRYSWTNIWPEGIHDGRLYLWPYNQNPSYANICLPYLKAGFEKFKYKYSYYDDNNLPIDRIRKFAVLACELKIGDKYLVEDFSQNPNTTMTMPQLQYNLLYSWKTLEECPDDGNGNKQTWFTIGINPSIDDVIIGKEFDIEDTVANWMKIGSEKGLAIPIPANKGLLGPVSFKILGPCNSSWAHAYQSMHHKFIWFKCYHDRQAYIPTLAFVENIIVKDFKIKFCQQEQNKSNNQDNDLVYYSYENNLYVDEEEFSCKFCTSLTDADASALGINYEANNSAIMKTNNTPFYGMTYKGVSNVKLEEARVAEQYNMWKRPRNLIETTLLLSEPEKAYLKTNFRFNYLKYDDNSPQIYRTLQRDCDLKYNTMKCVMKEFSDN